MAGHRREAPRGVIRIRFVSADGSEVHEVDAAAGERLLDVAQAAGQPLEGTCEGQMACSTCHVIVAAEDFVRLPPASEEEEDLLDLAAGVGRTSRLACQIRLSEALEKLTVRMPGVSHNMQGR
ncbi:MAG: ferredoxin-2, mitochondrial [Sphingomonadales bacterium]|nr:ferredoxin-2, mitochondrial [Sphingomonadales bacterium]